MPGLKSMKLVAEGQPLRETACEAPALGPRSVLVKVRAAGVCHTDIHLISGAWDLGEGRRLSTTRRGAVLPLTPGHEIAGQVERLGAEAASSGFKSGDEVIVYPWIGCRGCRSCQAGSEHLCEGDSGFLGITKDGGYAEYVLVPDSRYLVATEGMDVAQAATLACSGVTAFSALKKCGVGPDGRLVVVGAGGLGTTAIQIAKKVIGAEVTVLDINDSKLELAAKLGADHVFNASGVESGETVATVKGLVGKGGADAVVDFVGNPSTASTAFRLLGRGGRLVIVGLAGGAVQLPLPIFPLLANHVLGSFTGSLGELRELVELARRGVVAPVVTASFGLQQANEVLDKLKRGEIEGRAVLTP